MLYLNNSDITQIESGIIAHGVNCQMVMGSGVAKALYTKWPHVKESYMNMQYPRLGQAQIFFVDRDAPISVANCFTQEYYGRDGKVYADLAAIKKSLSIVSTYYPGQIHIPKIGCGLGGLDWPDVEEVLKEIEEERPVEFLVHTL